MKERQPCFDRNVYALFGLLFDAVDLMGAVQSVQAAVLHRERYFLSTPNLNFLIASLHDASFRNSVIHSDLSVADGMPLIWIARLLQIPLPERVSGAGIFESLQAEKNKKVKVFFFGGIARVAELACQRANATSGGVRCVGYESPGFGSIEQMSSKEIIDRINASEADFLVVALGAKKGNAWIEHNLFKLTVPVVSHLGAVINFVAGTVSRAPVWMQQFGLEWLWRIKEEPLLLKRYFFDGIALVRLLSCRILPYAWYVYRHRPSSGEVDLASISIDIKEGRILLKLRGAWYCNNLEPVRAAFKLAAKDGADVHLDMADVSYVDSALIGLLMLLFGYQQQEGRRLSVVSVSNSVQRIFRWSCVEFLLRDENECG